MAVKISVNSNGKKSWLTDIFTINLYKPPLYWELCMMLHIYFADFRSGELFDWSWTLACILSGSIETRLSGTSANTHGMTPILPRKRYQILITGAKARMGRYQIGPISSRIDTRVLKNYRYSRVASIPIRPIFNRIDTRVRRKLSILTSGIDTNRPDMQ